MVLGDDIVICNPKVARKYLDIMSDLGVEISKPKTLASPLGVFEFAKKFSDPERSLEGLPLNELQAARLSLSIFHEFIRKIRPRMADAMRVAGFGYKVRGNTHVHKIGVGRSSIVKQILLSPLTTLESIPTTREFLLYGSKATEEDLRDLMFVKVNKFLMKKPPEYPPFPE